ncbi:MAG: SURF1 family protein [Betaproteobacteria bacterium]
MGQTVAQAGSRRGRPGWLPALAAILGIALTVAAGNWQLNRAHQKERLQQDYERGSADAPILLSSIGIAAEDVRLRRVELAGTFDPRGLVLLDNKIRDGRPGYEVIMPVRIGDSAMHVLVDRGWVAVGSDRKVLPEIRTPDAVVKIQGIATVPGRFFELSKAESSGPVWQNLTIERYITRTGLQVQPVVVRQQSELPDGLLRSTERPDFGIAKHYGYAVQWFSFCGLIVFLYAYFHVKTWRQKKNAADVPAPGND